MKTLILTTVLTLFTSSALIAGEPAAYVIAERTEHPGFVNPQFAVERTIRIYSSGMVTEYNHHLVPNETDAEIPFSHIAPAEIEKIRGIADAIDETTLIDMDAGKPMCMDRPSIDYAIHKSSGAADWEIAQEKNCHHSCLRNDEGGQLIRFLDALAAEAPQTP